MAQNIRFTPIRGTQAKIQRLPIKEGYLYFAYDTGNMYLDKDGSRHLMGGNAAGIIYTHGSTDDIVKEFPDDETSITYLIPNSVLDDSAMVPKADSLILNSDGRFFRVKTYDGTTITATLLAVSGTGGGGGGGSIITYSDRAKLNKRDPESNYLINGKSASISIYGVSGKDYDGSILDERLTVYWFLSERTSTGILSEYARGTFPIAASTDDNPVWEEFEYGTRARHSTTNVLTMYVIGSASTQSREFSYEFYTSDLQLLPHTAFNNVNYYSPGDVTIYCSTLGDLEKIIYYYFEYEDEMIPLNPNGNVVRAGTTEENFVVPAVYTTHGVHKVRIELYQYINGRADKTSAATPIEMEIAVVDRSSSLPVIWLGNYNNEYYQYDSIKIPYRVYDPANTLSVTVTLFKDNIKIGTRTITDSSQFSIWEIVDADLNMENLYTISCGQDENEVRRDITFLVSEDPAREKMKLATANLLYLFDASGRSNSESSTNRVKCNYTTDKGTTISASLENFNWYNNGWVTDQDSGNACLRVSNGARFSVPLGQTKLATAGASEQSYTFEFQFKVRNVQDYSQILHNVTRYKGNTDDRYDTYPNWSDIEAYNAFTSKNYLEWSGGKEYDNYDAFLQWYLPAYIAHYPDSGWPPSYDDIEYRQTDKILNTNYASGTYYDGQHGICIGAQDALFTNGTDTVNVAYVEDKLINLTIVYSHGEGTNDGSDKLMSIYLNGMLTGVTRSTLSEPWNIGIDDNISLIFDSQYCDFDLYKIRVYNTALTLPAILVNYTVDLKNPVAFDLTQLAYVDQTLQESKFRFEDMIAYNNAHPDGYIMPYLVLTTKPSEDNALPFSKQQPRADVLVEFVNTGLERAYTTGELNELAQRAGQTVEEYYMHHCPSWIADHVALSVQGTSSEFYPRRNYKAKTKNPDPADPNKKKKVQMYMNRGPFAQTYVDNKDDTHLDWFYYDNDTVGTTKFTLKIDYMESSGTYNMGFANLVYNAYTHHPLYDYNKAHAFVVEDPTATIEVIATEYDANITYYYRNHKGNWKTASSQPESDNLVITSAEDFAKGPYQLAQEQQLPTIGTLKVASEGAEGYNTWYIREPGYKDAEVSNIDDYRTSVQGFPVLTFHQTTDDAGNVTSIKYIGRYNMLLDKGSDEAYGFKPMETVYQKFVTDDAGRPKAVSDVAECWEAENNSRGFCSFRDAAINRASDDNRFFDTDKLTAAGAPIVADYWEYRYSAKGDTLDVLYDLANNIDDAASATQVSNDCHVDITDQTIITSPDPSYTGTYTQGMKNAGDALLDIYANWERAVKWVWSTDQDSVPSAGTYTPVDLGVEVYTPNTYYINNNGEFVLDSSATYNDQQIYYVYNNEIEEYEGIKLCASAELQYEPNVYYIVSGLGDYVLDPDGVFNASATYYILNMDEAHSGAKALTLTEPENVNANGGIIYNDHEYKYDTKEYRNAKFVNDLRKHFNLEYLVTYFVMTEVFECYDSRGKNAMFGSWGPQERGGDYIWYPMFYDIDTQLGINNTGIPSFEYYVDATEDGTFSTNDSVLWNNLYRNFRGAIIQKYRQLRGVKSNYDTLLKAPLKSIDRIEKWYLADPDECGSIVMRGERPLMAFNLDEFYKYITITNSRTGGGYQDRYGGTGIDNGTYFYALQGDRSLSRQQFLTNRLNYIDSWLNQGNYERGGTNIIRGRVAANSPSNTSDKWIDIGGNKGTEPTLQESPYWTDATETQKTHLFDGEYWLDMEPVRNSYVTVGTDTANFPSLKYTNLEGPVRFKTPDLENGVRRSGGYHEQLYYIYGLDQMKSLGDMSRLYWTEFNIEGSATKMTDLLLGYDGLDENNNNYANNGINLYGLHASNSAGDKGGMPLLKRINLSYIQFNHTSPTYDFSSCEKLEDFRAIGSNITNVTFADGVALKTLYLPATITKLHLTEATKLNNIVTSFRARKDAINQDVYPGLYIPGLTDKNPGDSDLQSNIEEIILFGDCLGYDSYKLLSKYYNARLNAVSSKITVTDVNWSPYKPITEGYAFDTNEANNGLYWLDSGHYSFDPYTAADHTEDKWNLAIKNGELYKLDTTIDASVISSTELLQNLKEKANFFSTAVDNNTVPIITGIMYIDNNEAVNEKDIESAFGEAYPDLKLFFKNIVKVPSAKYVILNDDGTYDLLARRSLGDNENYFPNPRNIISLSLLDNYDTRSRFDFFGWSEQPLNPAAAEALPEDWYQADKGYLIQTTNNSTSVACVPINEQYDKWNEQVLVAGKVDYTFYAVYRVHKFVINFYSGEDLFRTLYIKDGANMEVPVDAPYKNDTNNELELTQVYKFIGYSTKQDEPATLLATSITLFNQEPIGTQTITADDIVNKLPTKVMKNWNLYAVFGLASVYDTVLDERYLSLSGNTLSFNENTISNVSGKVTLPLQYSGIDVREFGVNYGGSSSYKQAVSNITHIFWQKPTEQVQCKLTSYINEAFSGWDKIIYVEIPDNVTHTFAIGSHCFDGCKNLFNNIKVTDADRMTFINRITSFGELGFTSICSRYENIGIKFLGNCQVVLNSNVTQLGAQAFANTPVKEVVFGSNEKGFVLSPTDANFGSNIFNNAGYGETFRGSGFNAPKVIYYYPATINDVGNLRAILETKLDGGGRINVTNGTLELICERTGQEVNND